MSAVLMDELLVPARVELRVVPSAPMYEALAPARAFPEQSPRSAATRLAHGSHGLRLTDRGIAVVLAGFAALFLTGFAVAVGGFLGVSDAPVSETPAAVVAAGALH